MPAFVFGRCAVKAFFKKPYKILITFKAAVKGDVFNCRISVFKPMACIIKLERIQIFFRRSIKFLFEDFKNIAFRYAETFCNVVNIVYEYVIVVNILNYPACF